jgi:hypothetical protein
MSIWDKEKYEKLVENKFNCLCTVDEVKCMCEEFKSSEKGTICHCGVYIND